MSEFYTFLSSLYNCLLKFISLIILLGEVRKFLGEVLKICAPPPKIRPWFNALISYASFFKNDHIGAQDCITKWCICNVFVFNTLVIFVELTMRKRSLAVTLAVTKGKMPQLLAEKDTRTKTPRDKRNLYLAKEGVILPGAEAAVGLSKSDLQKRQKAEAEKKAKLKMPHYIVSKTRCDWVDFFVEDSLV